ncbi:hypothetical protein MKW98_028100 [Papaver atlanticum]|uniref:Uncharacterized protein n=1 Tax=Papaver atlanticum TaxID=357466 RepID=A0AAD4SXM9_9MAGN|nr:hypothetical protein MKW98_028100 [Papaver atlanticum]
MRLMGDYTSRVNVSIIYVVVGLVILALVACEGSAFGGFWKSIHASVRNDISDQTVLTIHCKSKDVDLVSINSHTAKHSLGSFTRTSCVQKRLGVS